jgi:alkanesulfonate monooxygenase SsuD/methylene tetrahydromethanopterin reductase-like flavin-dependent oxidoreductase (luciferase family)
MFPEVGVLASPEMLQAPAPRRRALFARVADAGLSHVFVADHVSFHTGLGMDGLIQAALALGLEPRLRVVVGVYLLALRHPVPVARQIATLCESAPGALTLGVGVGGEDRHEIEICGVDPRTRGRRTDEALAALRSLLSGEPTSFRGEFFAFEDALVRPAPLPPVPLLVGGRSDAAVRRAGRLGDGWLGVWCSPARFARVVAEVREHAGAAGRATPSLHGLQVWLGVGAERARARQRLARAMEAMYRTPFERFERYSPCGTPAEVADFLAPYAEAGARLFNLMPVADSAEAGIDAVAEIRERLLGLLEEKSEDPGD